MQHCQNEKKNTLSAFFTDNILCYSSKSRDISNKMDIKLISVCDS